MADLSLVTYYLNNFWMVKINTRPFTPSFTLLTQLVESLVLSEPEPDTKNLKRLEWIYKNTHEKVNEQLSTVELVVFRNLDKGINFEIEIGGKTFYLFQLYNFLDSIARELGKIVTEIAKKYNVDMPMITPKSDSQTIHFG